MTERGTQHPILLTAQELADTLGISTRQVWRLVRHDHAFPKPVRVGRRSTRFRQHDVLVYVNLKLQPEGR